MITETPISLSKIKEARGIAFSNHQIERDYPTHRSVTEYEETLPSFQGQTFIQHIEDRGSALNVLDVGCGEGSVLSTLKSRYPHLRVFGLTAHDYTSRLTWSRYLDKVDYRVGDAQRLSSVFRDINFDIVVSLYAFEYFADPLAALKQAYMTCNEGGIVFIDKFTKLTMHQAELLARHLREQGVGVNLRRFAPNKERFDPSMYSIAFQRGQSRRLHLPFRYSRVHKTSESDGMEGKIPGIRLSYSFDESLVLAENISGANPVSSK